MIVIVLLMLKIQFFCPLWGSEDLKFSAFVKQVAAAGYDGGEMSLPPTNQLELNHRILFLMLVCFLLVNISKLLAPIWQTPKSISGKIIKGTHKPLMGHQCIYDVAFEKDTPINFTYCFMNHG